MKKQKPYDQMTTAELQEATKEFDQEFVADTFGPLSPANHAAFQRALRRGRPKVGGGAKRINISIERSLLKKTDALAKREKSADRNSSPGH